MSVEYLQLEAKMDALARTFPSVINAPGVPLWDANTFDRWAADTAISHGELRTAQFLLAVWDSQHAWQCGPFNLMESLRVWDDRHRTAFLAWVHDPWWP